MELKPKRVILHCAATPDYPDSSKKYDLYGAADIDVWHKKNGWNGIGYHYVIRRTGEIEGGRPTDEVGAHCKGENHDSIGVCYVGTRWPTQEQVKALVRLYRKIKGEFGISYEDWYGHREFNRRKTCPGVSIELVRELFEFVEKKGENGALS